MTVTEAMSARRSIRAYKPDAPDRAVITEVLEAAARTPSWANTQTWEVFVATGSALRRIRSAYAENYKNAVKSATEIARPAEWTVAALRRMKGLRPDMARDCGEAANQFGELNQRMFDAPVVIFLCVDTRLTQWALYDLGAYAQSVMLLAAERGIATITAITSVSYPDVLRRELNIPDNLKIAIGIPMGYADYENKINNFVSARSPISDYVRFPD